MSFHAHSPFYSSEAENIDEKLGRANCSQFNSITLIVSDKVADENEAPWDTAAPVTMWTAGCGTCGKWQC